MAIPSPSVATPSRFERFDRSAPVWIVTSLALLALILLPLGWLAYTSVSGRDGLTLAHYARVVQDPRLARALWNTIVLAIGSGLPLVKSCFRGARTASSSLNACSKSQPAIARGVG